jgi:hypothetical protein
LLESPAILIGGILSLIELVVAALLDFFKREPRFRYDIYSKAESYRTFQFFIGLTLVEWSMLALMQFVILPPELGWPIYVLCFFAKMLFLQKDFVRRRRDVTNVMFRVSQYQFLATAITLVAVSYYVHSKPAKAPTTAPAPGIGPGARDLSVPQKNDLLKD